MVTREEAPYICSPCFTMCNSKKSYDQHCSGKLHLKKCKEAHSSSSVAETSIPGVLSCSVCNLKYENLKCFIEHCYSVEHASNILKKVKVQDCEGEPTRSLHCTPTEEKEERFSSCDQTSIGVNQISIAEDNSSIDHVDRPESKVVPSPGIDVPQENSAVQPCHDSSTNDDGDKNKDFHYCAVCDVPVMGLRNYKEHLQGSKHQKQKAKQSEKKSSDIEKDNLSDSHPNFQMNNNQFKYQSSHHHVIGNQTQIRANQAKHGYYGKQSHYGVSVDHYSGVHPEGGIALGTTQTNCKCNSSYMGINHMNLIKSPGQVSRCQEIGKYSMFSSGPSQPNLGDPSQQMNGQFFCSTCSVPCTSRKSLEQHCRGKAHKKKCEDIHGMSYSTGALVGTKAIVPNFYSHGLPEVCKF
ncbi:uncharacterized protein LOC143035053 [Oratosquilla oratoria]|uniref:uncharacterized protein LOC143035053 n=1 Tax=Oratosquilla oratoria TaxID=337810 RepID=UPI003F761E24